MYLTEWMPSGNTSPGFLPTRRTFGSTPELSVACGSVQLILFELEFLSAYSTVVLGQELPKLGGETSLQKVFAVKDQSPLWVQVFMEGPSSWYPEVHWNRHSVP